MAIFDDDSLWLVLRRLLGRPEPGPANLSVPPRLYRQGDVLLLEVAQLPADAVRETRRGPRLVLAWGRRRDMPMPSAADAAKQLSTATTDAATWS